MESNLPWLRSILNDALRKKKIKWRLKNTHAGVWMWGLCKCKMLLIPGDVRIASECWAAHSEARRWEYEELQLPDNAPPNVFGWAAWFVACGVVDCSAAGSGPEESSPVSFMAEWEKTPQWRSSLSSHFVSSPHCHFSQQPQLYSATFHKGCCCCRALSTHCLVLKNEDNAHRNNTRAFVCVFLFFCVRLFPFFELWQE